MTPETDLFGDPLIKRSAIFNGPRIRRVLTREWDANLPRSLVIGNNPSDAGADREDNTSRWWNRWFMHWGFGAYDAMNLNPFITSDPAEAHRIAEMAWEGPNWHDRDELHRNIGAVGRAAKKAEKVFVCWGAMKQALGLPAGRQAGEKLIRRSMATIARKRIGEANWRQGEMMLGHVKASISDIYALPDPANLGLALEATESIIDEIEALAPGSYRTITALKIVEGGKK